LHKKRGHAPFKARYLKNYAVTTANAFSASGRSTFPVCGIAANRKDKNVPSTLPQAE